ncbi:MAG TPA: type II toxin-antitoxin system PemK/MazF family toxin [Mycobacteriales bacterium]
MAKWGGMLRRAARRGRDLLAPARPGTGTTATKTASRPAVRTAPTRDRARTIAYAPRLDGDADPGEVVWAWVPYEENDGRGKDRPLLVVGRDRSHLLGLMLSSRHDRAGDRNWLPVGSGDWDPQGRESWVRLDRVLEVPHHGIRREGAVLGRDRFERVATELRAHYGWS